MERRYTRHDELPVYEHRTGRLDANLCNRARLLLKGAGGALRLPLPGLRNLEIILQPDAWIVVDRSLDDIPLLAWSAFRGDDEHPLSRPVSCRVRLFHGHANLLIEQVLGVLVAQLAELRLPSDGDDGGERGRVLAFRNGR